MNTELTTEMMNEVIALFMGGSSIKEHGGKRYVYYLKSCAKEVSDLKYHTSWDELMNAWLKLRKTIWQAFAEYPSDFCAISDAWEQYCFVVDIVGAHDVLYKAIQWFNQQKQLNEQRD